MYIFWSIKDPDLDAVFKLKNDKCVRCNSKLLASVSTYFRFKIAGHRRFNEPLEFDYQNFDVKTVVTYLQVAYGIDHAYQSLGTLEQLKLLKFLTFEGKSHVSAKVHKSMVHQGSATFS